MSRQSRRRSDGIALVSVLWLLLLLSGLAATVTAIARINAQLTHRGLDVAQGEAAADAAIIESIGLLSDEQWMRHPALSDSPRTMKFDNIPVTIRVSNEAGRIDINSASDELILAFLQSQGLTQDHATDMLRDLRQFQGREDTSAGMSTDGLSVASDPDGVLQAVDELRQIDSWRGAGLECWADSLTVFSQQAEVDTVSATWRVLAAVQWLRAHRGLDPLTAQSSAGGRDVSLLGGIFRIQALAKTSSEVSVEREWVGRVTGDIHHPALTMLWSSRPSHSRGEKCGQ